MAARVNEACHAAGFRGGNSSLGLRLMASHRVPWA